MCTKWSFTAIVLGSFLSGCSESDSPAGIQGNGRLMGAVFQSLDNPFFVELNEGIKEVVAAHGDRLTTLDSQWDSLKQRDQISELIANDASVVFINPVNWEGIKSSLLEMKGKGIPGVVVDAPVNDADLVLCQVASDNVEAGRMAARALLTVQKSGKLVILHIPTNKACIDRVDGFRRELAEHSQIQILEVCDGKGTAEGSQPAMRGLLEKYPDLTAVFGVNDPSALGVIAAIETMGRKREMTVVSVDGSSEGIAAVKARKLYSTSAQFPREIGRIAAQRVYEHFDGNPVEKEIKVPLELITPDNVSAFSPKH